MPIVLITGDAAAIYDADGNKIFKISEIGDTLKSAGDGDNDLKESVKNVLLPFLTKGLLGGNYDEYYAQLEKEIGELFEQVRLDNNGDPQYGTGILPEDVDARRIENMRDQKSADGTYGCYDYHFWYDWRLDPMQIADDLHEYILNVRKVTGAEKVGLISSCLGTNVCMAYIAKYNDAFPLEINGFGVNAALINGSEFIGEAISGKFHLDANGLNRLFIDTGEWGWLNVPEIVTATLDLAQKSGLLDGMSALLHKTLYDKLVEGVTSALALATFFTMPGYWACVSNEDYDEAIRYVFGPEGSEKRTQYAGLIAKLDNYHNTVSRHVPELMQSIHDNNVKLCIESKYGFQMVAVCESSEVIGDQFSSVTSSSFGATTAPSIYETLSDDYIAQRVAEGKGKYISPDKQIDASTCQFPDYTWFVKGATHSERTGFEDDILTAVVSADRQLTVDDIKYTQFMVYDKHANTMEPMTEENCHTELWTADYETDHPSNIIQRLRAFFASLKNWLKVVFEAIKVKIAEKQAEG
ncbi:MAG: hypothetical protein IJL52_01260 [Clostridia bacterium]|nr:hypothetical protein [Clostridia bacterium]